MGPSGVRARALLRKRAPVTERGGRPTLGKGAGSGALAQGSWPGAPRASSGLARAFTREEASVAPERTR